MAGSMSMNVALCVSAVLDAILVIALADPSDRRASEYTWGNGSIFDVGALAVARVGIVLVAGVCSRFGRARFARSLLVVTLLCACSVFSIVKLAACHAVHQRSAKVQAAVWIALVLAAMEAGLAGLSAASNKAQGSVTSSSSLSENNDEHAERIMDGLGYRLLEHGDKSYSGTGASFRRVLALAWPERYIISAALVCLFIASGSQMIIPALFGKIIETISDSRDQDTLDRTVLLMVLVFTITSVFAMLRGALFSLAGERVVARLRVRVFDAVLSQDISFFDVSQSGELQSRLSNDATKIQDACTANISMGLRWLAQIVVGLAIIFAVSAKLTLIMLTCVPAIAIGARFFGMRMKRLSSEYQDSLAKSGEVAEQAFSSIRTVRSFSKEEYEIQRYRKRIVDSYERGVKIAWSYGAFIGGIGFSAYLAIALVLWYGGRLVLQDQLDASKLTAFLLYTIYIAVALGGLSGLYSSMASAVGASERMFEIIDKEPLIHTDKLEPDSALRHRSASFHNNDIVGAVRFENVSFSYPSRPDVEVLKGVTFDCPPGQITALVGESGGGKSSLINLLLRFYDPNRGSLSIDGVNIRSMNTVKLHSIVGVVSQQPVLFSMSIADNIRYGVHRLVTQEEIETAAREANAFTFIQKFPEKFNTVVGERGVTLSGGERQRIAIARALLNAPKILLLDEATSALDSTSEQAVQEALDRCMKGKTSIVIAHRLSTVRDAACIHVVENGTIVECGTHKALMSKRGAYATLVQRQLKE